MNMLNRQPVKENLVQPEALVPGARYAVRFDDCCIDGVFEGLFIGWRWEPYDSDKESALRSSPPDFDRGEVVCVFDTGEALVHWGAETFERL